MSTSTTTTTPDALQQRVAVLEATVAQLTDVLVKLGVVVQTSTLAGYIQKADVDAMRTAILALKG